MASNIFLDQLGAKPSPTEQSTKNGNIFLEQLEGRETPKKPFSWTEGLGVESAYRFPLLGLQGVGGAIAGEPGDLLSAFHSLGNLISQPDVKQEYQQTPVGKGLPTSEKLLKESALQPKNIPEQFIQNLAHDATKLILPGRYLKGLGKVAQYAISPLRSLAISAGANTVGQGIESYTGSKSKGDLARHGSLLLFSLFNPQSAEKLVGQTYSAADSLLPQGASVAAGRFENALNSLERKILQGRGQSQLSPSEKWIIDRINDYRPIIQNGRVDVRQLVAQNRSTNERSFELYNFGKKERARAKNLVGNITNAAKNEMQSYGQINPQWWELQKSANQAFGAIEQSNFIKRMIAPLLKGKEGSVMAHIFGSGVAGLAGALSKPTAGTAAALYQGAKYGYRIAKSPLLAKHYGTVLMYAAMGNKERLAKALDEFERAVKKDQKKRSASPPLDKLSKKEEAEQMEMP